jgi:tetratricopeptide (TPR) repeat protein
MIDQKLLEKAREAANKNETGMFEAEKIFLDHLTLHPQDTDVRIMLSLLLYTTPWVDSDAALANLNTALSYEKDQTKRAYCLLIMAYIWEHTFRITEELYEQIVSLEVTNPTILAMLEIAKAWYHRGFDNYILYEQSLKKSIEYDSTTARNYYDLGEYYINKKHRYKEGNDLIRKAIANVNRVSADSENFVKLQGSLTSHEKKIYTDDFSDLDNTSVQQFLDERYKMLRISFVIYNNMRSYLL